MDIYAREKGIYAFGPFRLDPVRRALLRGGARVKLGARLFDTLHYLVQNHDRLVERDELQQAVWQGRAVEEGNLGQAISALRKALQSAEATEEYIVTITGRGYRFGAPVAFEPEAPVAPGAPGMHGLASLPCPSPTQRPDHPALKPPRRRRLLHGARAAWLGVPLTLGGLGLAVWWRAGPSPSAPLPHAFADLATRRAVAAMAANLATGTGWTDGHRLQNSRLTFLFGSSTTGYSTANADRVDAIVWIDSAGRAVSNYIAQADRHCDDAIEYFGEAYGNGSGSRPYAVIDGVASPWSAGPGSTSPGSTSPGSTSPGPGGAAAMASTTVTGSNACSFALDAATRSSYALSGSPDLVNTLKISRTFTFAASASAGDLRPYIARVPAVSYPYVIYPDRTNTLHTVHTVTCNQNCVVTDWNGKWLADDSGGGAGIAIFRAPNAALHAEITVDYDDDSASSASAVTLVQPAAGWPGIVVTETEYLCFYDAASWSAAERAAGLPPAGCTGVPH